MVTLAILWRGSAQHIGPFGDFIGGTLNPLLTFMGLLITIVLQQTELRGTLAVLNVLRPPWRGQIDAIYRQSFESRFLQMLTLHNTIVNSIGLFYSCLERAIGRDCFSQFFDNFKDEYFTTSDRADRELLQMAYDAFWQRQQQDPSRPTTFHAKIDSLLVRTRRQLLGDYPQV